MRVIVARYKKLNQDALLDAAEAVIREKGAHALSIGTVAAAANVSRGGIQSAFGSKEELVKALFKRWEFELETLIDQIRSESVGDCDSMDIFLKASREIHLSNPQRNAAMMTLMAQSEEHRQWARNWIFSKMGDIDVSTPEGKQCRLKLLLFEGLFVMKSIRIVELSDQEWLEIFDDLERLLN